MSQDTRHSYSCNRLTRVYVEGRGGYRSHISHYSSHNQVERSRLLTFSGDTIGGDGRFGYRSHTNHSSFQRVDSRVHGSRSGSRSEDINRSFFYNVG